MKILQIPGTKYKSWSYHEIQILLCLAYGKICNNCGNKGHFAKCCNKKKGIHSLNQECSDNTAQDDSPNDCENVFIGTINFQNSSPSDSNDINLENTNNLNVSTERLSDNSSYRIFDDNSKVTDKRKISIQNKSDNDNLQDTQNVNNLQCLNISRDIYIDVIDKKKNSDWNVLLQTNDCIITYKVNTGAQANVISKQTLACIPKSVVIKPTNVKLPAYNGSRIPVIGSCILNISTKHKIHSVQFIVIDSNSPLIIGLKTSEELNLLKCLSNINVNKENWFL